MSNADFPRPPHNTPPVRDLKVYDGFACNLCKFVNTSRDAIHWKHRVVHRDVLRPGQIFYRSAKVQVKPIRPPTPNARADILTWS